jgi:hypothetical protein
VRQVGTHSPYLAPSAILWWCKLGWLYGAQGSTVTTTAGAFGPGLPQPTPARHAGGVGLAPVNYRAVSLASPGRARENAGRGHRVARGPGAGRGPGRHARRKHRRGGTGLPIPAVLA